jgi:hypothetical protein
MDRIRELLGRISELEAEEIGELRGLIIAQIGEGEDAAAGVEMSVLEELADASTAVKAEIDRRAADATHRAELASRLAEFRQTATPAEPVVPVAPAAPAAVEPAPVAPAEVPPTGGDPVAVVAGGDPAPVTPPADRAPRSVGGAITTAITAGADLPGFAMGADLSSASELAEAFSRRIETMRGISRGGDGDKILVASAKLQNVPDDLYLRNNDAEGNLAKVLAMASPKAITAAGGLGATRDVRYDLFGLISSADRPVKNALPVFRTERGGVRFMRTPTLNDINAVVGIWTVQNDIDAATNPAIRKPSFRINPGPEIVVDTQAITLILTFGNLMTRAYPELVARHNELALVAQARVAEQQLLTQIGALSTAVTGRAQKLGAAREMLLMLAKTTAAYRNRHRMNNDIQLRAILPVWFRNLLRADLMVASEDLVSALAITDAQIEGWFRNINVNITWSMDGEAGQDYSGLTLAGAGAGSSLGIADFPANLVWYLFAEGTFAFMDGGTLDLGLVRDSTLNAANDYQMFVETFENIVKFGNDAFRITSPLVVSGRSASDPQYVGAL